MRIILTLCLFGSFFGMLFFLSYNNFQLFLICLSAIPSVLVLNYFDNNRQIFIRKLKTVKKFGILHKPIVSIKKINYSPKEAISKLIVESPLLKNIYNFSVQNHINTFEKSGKIISSEKIAISTINGVVISLIFSIIGIVVLYQLYPTILLFAILFVPVIVYLHTSMLGIKEKINNRKKSVEEELLFFIVFCDIVDNTQSNILKVFECLSDESFNVFPAMKTEAIWIKREIEWFGKSINEIFYDLSIHHPSKQFSDFILGYITNENFGGGQKGNYFETKINELYKTKQNEIDSYSRNAVFLAPMGVFSLSMIPMFLMIVGIFEPGNVVFLMIVICISLVPIIMVIVIKKIESMVPLINDKIPFRKEPVVIAIVTLVACVVLGFAPWEIIAYPLIVWAFLNHFASQKLLCNSANFEKSMPRFVNELNKAMIMWDFLKSFKTIAKKQQYNKEFNSFLSHTYDLVDMGESIDEVLQQTKINSWVSRLTIQLISFTSKTGMISNHTMNKLSELSQKWIDVKSEMISGTVMGLVLAYVGPLIALLLIIMIPAFSIEEQVNSISNFTNIEADNSITDSLTSLNYLLLFVIAFFGTMLTVKIRTMTIHNSLHIGLVMLVMVIILHFDKYVGISF